MTTIEKPLLISVDDHVIEPPNLWVDKVPRSDRERVPHVVEEDGASIWLYEDVRIPIPGCSCKPDVTSRRSFPN